MVLSVGINNNKQYLVKHITNALLNTMFNTLLKTQITLRIYDKPSYCRDRKWKCIKIYLVLINKCIYVWKTN